MSSSAEQPAKRILVGSVLIGLGLLLWMDVSLLWPMFVLVPGLLLLAVAVYGGHVGATLAIPATLVTGTGALLFVQNLTGYWDSWSYAWTLYGAFLGAGFMIMGRQLNSESLETTGRGFILVSLIGFMGFAFLFELVLGVGGPGNASVGALLLVGAGSFLLLRNLAGQPSSSRRKLQYKPKRSEPPLFTGPVVYNSRHNTGSRPVPRPQNVESEAELVD
ncbi:MAG: hypothetical protein GXY36_02020 [Chloroflexi bacterium]|nr:hypothetical protein [Chloroflexota bacterium]